MSNRLHRAAEFADNVRDVAEGADVAALADEVLNGYLDGVEDALRWVLGTVPETTITDVLYRSGVTAPERLLPAGD